MFSSGNASVIQTKKPRALNSGPFVPRIYERRNEKLIEETIRTHRGVTDAIAARNPTAAHDAMYLHLAYNRNMIAEGAQTKSKWQN